MLVSLYYHSLLQNESGFNERLVWNTRRNIRFHDYLDIAHKLPPSWNTLTVANGRRVATGLSSSIVGSTAAWFTFVTKTYSRAVGVSFVGSGKNFQKMTLPQSMQLKSPRAIPSNFSQGEFPDRRP